MHWVPKLLRQGHWLQVCLHSQRLRLRPFQGLVNWDEGSSDQKPCWLVAIGGFFLCHATILFLRDSHDLFLSNGGETLLNRLGRSGIHLCLRCGWTTWKAGLCDSDLARHQERAAGRSIKEVRYSSDQTCTWMSLIYFCSFLQWPQDIEKHTMNQLILYFYHTYIYIIIYVTLYIVTQYEYIFWLLLLLSYIIFVLLWWIIVTYSINICDNNSNTNNNDSNNNDNNKKHCSINV